MSKNAYTKFSAGPGHTTKSFIAKWDGTIKAGVDVGKITVDLNTIEKSINISLPQAEILSHEIDENSFETLDESDGLFNPIQVEDVHTLNAVSKDAMEKRAIDNGLLDKAQKNAQEIITNLIQSTPGISKDYTITFTEISQ